jgi:uncharacterized protein YifE (UPF0438 family)
MHMSKVPPDHLVYLRRRPFAFRCSTSIFPADEMQALSENGNWMEALAAGAIQPVTPEQEHFLQVDREEVDPSTVCERAWVRLKGRREYEQEQAIAEPPSPPEDYGMIEWDADRCWW